MNKPKNKIQKITISGYYGFGNMGDEGILASLISLVKKELPNCRINVLCADKKSLVTYENDNVKPISRSNIFAILKAIITSDLFLSGGGSLLQDHSSKRSLLYYCILVHLAKLCRCKTAILANGIGPLKNEKLCSLTLLSADRVSLRDSASFSTAKRLAPGHTDLNLSADLVFSYPFFIKGRPFLSCLSVLSEKPFFAVSLRECDRGEKINEEEILLAIKHYRKKGYVPVFVPMQEKFDLAICKRMAKATGGMVADVRNLQEMFFLIEKASFAIGMRLHFLLTAAIAGVPIVPLSYDCKIRSCTSDLPGVPCLCAFTTTSKEIIQATEKVQTDFSKADIHNACIRLSELAKEDIRATLSLMTSASPYKGKTAKSKFFADT